MTRNLKALGLALLAVFALGAVTASAASAAPEFEALDSETNLVKPATAHAEQEEKYGDHFHLNGNPNNSLSCETATFDGVEELEGPQTKVELTPTFGKPAINTEYKTGEPKNCHAETPLGTKQVTVTHNECKLNFHPEETTEAGNKNSFVGSVEITGCATGKGIEIHVYNTNAKHEANESLCTYTVPNQKLGGKLHTKNIEEGKKHHITIETTAGGLEVTTHRIGGSGLICGPELQTSIYTAKDTADAKNGAGETVGATITDP